MLSVVFILFLFLKYDKSGKSINKFFKLEV